MHTDAGGERTVAKPAPGARWRRLVLPIVFLGAGIGGLALLIANRPQALPVERAETEWLVATVEARLESLAPTLHLYGRLESPRETELSSAMDADVLAVGVLEGDSVDAGVLLVELDDTDARLAVAQREAEIADIRAQMASETHRHRTDRDALRHEQELLELGRVAVERARRLAQSKAGTESSVDAAREEVARRALTVTNRENSIRDHSARLAQYEARLARADAALAQARRDLERSRVAAPFDARIAAVHVSPGDRARRGDRLVDLYDRDYVEIRVQVPNRHLETLRRMAGSGLPITGSATLDGRPLSITPQRLAARVERGRGGVDAFFRVDNPGVVLELGRTVTVSVELPAIDAVVALPFEALYGNDRLYKLEDGRLRSVPVTRVGERTIPGGYERVLVQGPDLQDGDRIVVSQLPNAVDGLRVRTRELP